VRIDKEIKENLEECANGFGIGAWNGILFSGGSQENISLPIPLQSLLALFSQGSL
jgi:hypothetical protein